MIFVPAQFWGLLTISFRMGPAVSGRPADSPPTGFVPVIIDNNCVAKRKRCKYRHFGETILYRRF